MKAHVYASDYLSGLCPISQYAGYAWPIGLSLILVDIFFPALDALQRDLGVSDIYITSNVAIFILFQGTIPILWSTISEVKGRKLVYILSMTLYVTGSAVASQAQTGPVFVC